MSVKPEFRGEGISADLQAHALGINNGNYVWTEHALCKRPHHNVYKKSHFKVTLTMLGRDKTEKKGKRTEQTV